MTVEDAQNALSDLIARGAGNVRLVGHDWDGNRGTVNTFEVDAGEEDEHVVWIEVKAVYVFSGARLALVCACVAAATAAVCYLVATL